MSLVPQCSAAGRFERAREGFLYRRVYSTLNYCIRNNSECESEPAFLLRCRPVTTTVAAAAAAAAAPGSCSSPVDVFFGLSFFFLGREKDQNREAHAESNRVEEEGGFKEERRLKGKGEEKEEEEEVIALGSVCSSSIPQLLSSALCALSPSLLFPRRFATPHSSPVCKKVPPPPLLRNTRASLKTRRRQQRRGRASLARTHAGGEESGVCRRSSSCKNSRATNPSSLRPLHFYPQFPFPFAGREARGQSGSSKGGAGVSGRFVQKRSPPFLPRMLLCRRFCV